MVEPAERLFVLGSFVMACAAGVDRLPQPGETRMAHGFTAEPGGKGFNVAVGARRLGAAVDCMIAVGDDMFGDLAAAAFAKADLSSSLLLRYPTATGAGVGFIEQGGENCVAVFPGANLSLSAANVHAAAAIVSTAALVLAQFEIGDEPIAAAFTLARAAGRATLLNPSPFRPPSPAILAATTILVLNETEAKAMGGFLQAADDAEADHAWLAEQLHDRGVTMVIVTLGARGAHAFTRGQPPMHQAAFPVASVDTLGAGDAFVAAFAVSFARRHALAVVLRRAAAAGALMASRTGTFDQFPDTAAIDRLAGPPDAGQRDAGPDTGLRTA